MFDEKGYRFVEDESSYVLLRERDQTIIARCDKTELTVFVYASSEPSESGIVERFRNHVLSM